MKRVILLTILGIGAYLVFATASAPAALVLSFLPDRSDYSVQGPSGTVWSGRFETIQAGQFRFGPVEWELSATALLTGAADADLRADVARGDVTGHVRARRDGNVTVTDLLAQGIDIATLAPLFQSPANTATGEGSIQIESLAVRDGVPVSGSGQIRVFDLAVDFMGQHRLGTYAGDFSGEDGQFTLTFTDAGDQAPFDLEGRLAYSVVAGEYSLDGRIRALPDASQALSNGLNYLGESSEDGYRRVSTSGRVRPNPFSR